MLLAPCLAGSTHRTAPTSTSHMQPGAVATLTPSLLTFCLWQLHLCLGQLRCHLLHDLKLLLQVTTATGMYILQQPHSRRPKPEYRQHAITSSCLCRHVSYLLHPQPPLPRVYASVLTAAGPLQNTPVYAGSVGHCELPVPEMPPAWFSPLWCG